MSKIRMNTEFRNKILFPFAIYGIKKLKIAGTTSGCGTSHLQCTSSCYEPELFPGPYYQCQWILDKPGVKSMDLGTVVVTAGF